MTAAIAAQTVLEQLDGLMGGDRGQRHVGAGQQFGLDRRDAVCGQAAHQFLGVQRTATPIGQADERRAGGACARRITSCGRCPKQ